MIKSIFDGIKLGHLTYQDPGKTEIEVPIASVISENEIKAAAGKKSSKLFCIQEASAKMQIEIDNEMFSQKTVKNVKWSQSTI